MDRRQFMKTGMAGTASLGVSRFVPGSVSSERSAPVLPSTPVKANLNGLDLIFDSETGSLLQMSYPGPEKMLEAISKPNGTC